MLKPAEGHRNYAETHSGKNVKILWHKIEKGKLLDSLFGITNPGYNQAALDTTNPEIQKSGEVSEIKDKRLISILQTNSSKVVDENGEPHPVWHITNEGFTSFEASKSRQNADIPAFYFATNKDDWKDMGSKAMPVFLNLRNPVE